MRATAGPLPGVHLLEPEMRPDERGFFARCFCRRELAALGIEASVEQANLSFSKQRGTLRGLHYQLGAAAETKIVTCTRGRLFDVVLDLRPGSPGFGQSFGAVLDADAPRIMVVPKACAHGLLTLEDDTEVFYLVSNAHDPVLERGVRWNDPAFSIVWPIEPAVISTRDRAHPDFDRAWHLAA